MTAAPSLSELQHAFAAAAMNPAEDARMAEWITGNGLLPRERMRIYRNQIFASLTDALATAYPAVKKLVGENFFNAAAARYIRNHPTKSGNLQDYGVSFPAFLACMPEAKELPYLADVARLEWARQQAFLAADATPLTPVELKTLIETGMADLRLALHPALQLVISEQPVRDIWLLCQQAAPDGLDLAGSGQAVALWREGSQIGMQLLDAGLREWLAALLAEESFAVACERALSESPDFAPAMALHWLLQNKLVVGARPCGRTVCGPGSGTAGLPITRSGA